jgi:hypothetical protein
MPPPHYGRRTVLGALALAAVAAASPGLDAGANGSVARNLGGDGLMLRGYDPVAYFTRGEATPGLPDITAEHDGAVYRFATAEHRALFVADPAAYVPAYGGFCAFGAAMGRKFDADPHAWSIEDGKLYVNLNRNVRERWLADPHGFIRSADHNWSLIEALPDQALEASPPAGLVLGAN